VAIVEIAAGELMPAVYAKCVTMFEGGHANVPMGCWGRFGVSRPNTTQYHDS
jgi:hypothetical protein